MTSLMLLRKVSVVITCMVDERGENKAGRQEITETVQAQNDQEGCYKGKECLLCLIHCHMPYV